MDEEYDNELPDWSVCDEEDDIKVVWEHETARDCCAGEEDMIQRGEFFL